MKLRDGFREIVSGWMLIDDFDDLTDRIERAGEWTKVNGPLEPDEQATIELMIEAQMARGMSNPFDEALEASMQPIVHEGELAPVDDLPDLGPCCMCEGTEGVRNLIMLDLRGTVPGHGWGCLGCGLPSDGASAVLCDKCLTRYQADRSLLTIACRGYPGTDGRIPIAELEPFEHDDAAHREG
jgi:hypothetical protein